MLTERKKNHCPAIPSSSTLLEDGIALSSVNDYYADFFKFTLLLKMSNTFGDHSEFAIMNVAFQ